jgi:hypothetical protein
VAGRYAHGGPGGTHSCQQTCSSSGAGFYSGSFIDAFQLCGSGGHGKSVDSRMKFGIQPKVRGQWQGTDMMEYALGDIAMNASRFLVLICEAYS